MHKGSWCECSPRFLLQSYCDAFQILGYLQKLERTRSLWEESFSHQTHIKRVLSSHAFISTMLANTIMNAALLEFQVFSCFIPQ